MTAKTSRPDRKGGGGRHGRQREPSEFSEATLSVDRVTRVVKGGRRMRFRAIVVVGNKKGKVGLGTGKATEVQAAVKKASAAAKRAMIRVPILRDTIPHSVELKFKAARIRRVRAKIRGTTARPRMSVHRSLKTLRVQLIDDTAGKTIAAASTIEAKAKLTKEGAKKLGELIAKKAKDAKVTAVVFDRGPYK